MKETSGELDKRNNCREVGYFYVVKHVWAGAAPKSVDGEGPWGEVSTGAEKWFGRGNLSLGKYLGDGVFRYVYTGTGNWTDDGSDTYGCAFKGSGAKDFVDAEGIDLARNAGNPGRADPRKKLGKPGRARAAAAVSC